MSHRIYSTCGFLDFFDTIFLFDPGTVFCEQKCRNPATGTGASGVRVGLPAVYVRKLWGRNPLTIKS